jgi:hypothetical protein
MPGVTAMRSHPIRLSAVVLGSALLAAAAMPAAARQANAAPTANAAPHVSAKAPTSRKQAGQEWSEDGLQKIKVKGLDVAYVRPGASVAPYKRVLVLPVSVSFRRDFERTGAPGGRRIRAQDLQRMRDRLAGLLREEFSKELAAGGYAPATAPGDDVLAVELAISDLYITAPDVQTIGRLDTYAVSAGEMTLIANLRDSASGEVLVRVYDNDEADESAHVMRMTPTENSMEARRMARRWAGIFRRELDAARQRHPAP